MASPDDPLLSVRWFWKDWRASTARAVLSPIERYAYRELLDAHYASDDCTIPDDDRLLAGLVDMTVAAWSRIRENVLAHIPPVGDGKRQHPRCLHEWNRGRDAREKVIRAGRSGGRERVRRSSDAQAPLDQRSSVAKAMLKPLPSPSSERSSEGSLSEAGAPAGAYGAGAGPGSEPSHGGRLRGSCDKGNFCSDAACCETGRTHAAQRAEADAWLAANPERKSRRTGRA